MYGLGKGVPQDYVEAYKWDNLAAAQNETNAIHNRDNISESMTASQIDQGQRLSREFVARQESGASNRAAAEDSIVAEKQPRFTGTGFFVTDDGCLLTSYHVVEDAARVAIRTKAGTFAATLVKADKANDVALLKVTGNFPALPVASSRGVKLGESIFTIGFPNIELQGFAPKLTKGDISSLTGPQDDPRYFQISTPVQPGNSGGALVDDRGNVVGVVSAKLDAATALAASGALPENVNYAIKSSFLLSFLESVPEVAAKMKEPGTKEQKFEDVVQSAEQAAVLVLVY
jgi:S1-C subfamily serine protease